MTERSHTIETEIVADGIRKTARRIAELEAQRDNLWMLLDDIDTAEDMFKPEINSHFRYVNRKHRRRFEVFNPDRTYQFSELAAQEAGE
jgi:hypothetical protein